MFTPAKHLPTLASLAAALVLVACSADSNTAAPLAPANAAMAVVRAPAPSVVAAGAIVAERAERPTNVDPRHSTMATVYPSNAVTYFLHVSPIDNETWVIGTHMVKFPANTICDPSKSTYGAGTWLNTCTKFTTDADVNIYATTWTDANGRPQIDFDRALRFYPNSLGQLPSIYLRNAAASLTSWGRVDYCSGVGACVNEAATDAVLVTQRDAATGFLFRLIRHFSGYNVWA